ncbi:MAG TPA: glycosyltransferase family 2 protein [Verrucomicrobiae bacterium]
MTASDSRTPGPAQRQNPGGRGYDLAVAYRIYPKVTKPTPIFPDDKLKLAELCLRSFRRAAGDLRIKVFALLDGCPPPYVSLFRDCFAEADLKIIEAPAIGNRPTFGRQLDLLLSQEDAELVYFAEDDYFYRPNALEEMVAFLIANQDAHFVTPYDHPDTYELPLHPARQEVRLHASKHWRTCASSCLTFLTRQSTLARTRRVFRTYQRTNLDVALWMALTKQTLRNPIAFVRCCRRKLNYGGYIAQAWRYSPLEAAVGRKWKLWCRIPSLATHMETAYLAPAVDWHNLFTVEGGAPPR